MAEGSRASTFFIFLGIRNPKRAFEIALNDYALERSDHRDVSGADGGYNVVFCYTKEAGGYRGVRTWTSYASKEEFDRLFTPERRAHETIVEEGVTSERAIELVDQTPVGCYIMAGIDDATDQETGEVDPFILGMKLKSVAFLMAFSGRPRA